MSTHPEPVLLFGKYRGQTVSQVPATYLKFLCCWENVRRDGKVYHQELHVDHVNDEIPEAQRYILGKQWHTMKRARQYAFAYAWSVSDRSFPSVLHESTGHGITIGQHDVTTNVVGRLSRSHSLSQSLNRNPIEFRPSLSGPFR